MSVVCVVARRTVARVVPLVGLLGLGFVSACGPMRPAVMPPAAFPKVALPKYASIDDATLLGYVRVGKPLELARRLGADKLLDQAGRMGVRLDSIRAGAPAGVFVWESAGNELKDLPLVAVLPTSPDGPIAMAASVVLSRQRVIGAGEDVIVATNDQAVERATRLGDRLLEVVRAPVDEDAIVYLRPAQLMRRYGDVLRRGLEDAGRSGLRGEPSAQAGAQMGQAMIAEILSGMERVDPAVVTLSFKADHVEATLLRHDLDGAEPPEAQATRPALARVLPAGDVRMQVTGARLRPLFDLYARMFEKMQVGAGGSSSAAWEWLRAWGAAADDAEMATNISFDPLRGIVGTAVVLTPRAEELAKLVDRYFDDPANLEAARALNEKLGVRVSVKREKAVRKVRGWPVDRIASSFEAIGDTPQARALRGNPIMRGMRMEIARVGSYIVYTMNGDDGALDRIVEDLLGQPAAHPALASTATFPGGGYGYLDVDVGRLWSSVREMLPASVQARVPALPPALPPVTLVAFGQGRDTWYRARVPNEVVRAVREALAQVRGR